MEVQGSSVKFSQKKKKNNKKKKKNCQTIKSALNYSLYLLGKWLVLDLTGVYSFWLKFCWSSDVCLVVLTTQARSRLGCIKLFICHVAHIY